METMLKDDDVKVRIAAADATARTLGTFWNVVNTKNIRTLINILLVKHISDSSSALVRVSAINAITMILENPDSHGLLRSVMPFMKNMIHDNTERVRLAMVKLLLKVKTIRGLKFYEIVSQEYLHAR